MATPELLPADPVIDYLDTPPQRWHQLGANGAFVERADGEWMKFADVDLYMFEGGQLMLQMVEEHKRLREALTKIAAFDPGRFRPLVDEIAIWKLATDALGSGSTRG